MNPRFAATSWSEPTASLARAEGRLALSFRRRGEITALGDLYQQGCAKARFPKVEAGAMTCAVTLNTAGGLTGGDRIDTAVTWEDGAAATIASQAAERAYRAIGPLPARLTTRLDIRAGANAEWLPQETILFDDCAIARDLRIELAPDASFTGIEQVVFGRTARGETVRRGSFRDAWRLSRGGRLVHADVLSLEGDMQARLDRAAVGQGARAIAALVHAAPERGDKLAELRNALGPFPLWGASEFDGIIVARLLAPTGADLRPMVIAALAVLRDHRPLPRVWQI
ncbi:urease accessory protein UreD [Zavarzinia sp.]|uniref:urease accessory protein UreD n=1 Tax=Zavarzinia sp. TaxID=2027920 RepID=UPI003564ED6C